MAPGLSKLGRFDLIERIGVGGFGSVWKARDKELDRTVAIKIPRAGGMTGEEQEKFFREARAAAQLKHPNIVGVHEVGRDGDSVYIVSDFVRGVTLGDWLTGQQITSREVAELCAKIADALHHAHEQGVVHRDLKPANIMIDGDGQPHLMDFGLARREVGEVTVTMDGQVLGTPAYMSPEQAQGEAHTADRRSDIYSLGVILFQLLTGELPYRGNARMLMHQVIHDEPPSPRKLNSHVSKDLETITLKCLEKIPSRRYQTAEDVANELRAVMLGEPILARPIGLLDKARRWALRKPAVAVLGLLSVFLVLLAISLLAIGYARESRLRWEADEARSAAEISETRAESNARVSQSNLYAARIYSAGQVWEKGDLRCAKELLESLRPVPEQDDLRGFEWYYLWKLCHSELTALHRKGVVRSVVFSPDGKILAIASDDQPVTLWSRSTERELRTLPGGTTPRVLRFAPGGRLLAVGNKDGTITLYDAQTGAILADLAGHSESVSALAFSPDGKKLVSGSAKLIRPGHNPIDRFRTPASDGEIILWDCEKQRESGFHVRHGAGVLSLAFLPDGTTVESAGADGSVKAWNFLTKEEQIILDSAGGQHVVISMALSDDGKSLAVGTTDYSLGTSEIRLWDVTTKRESETLKGSSGPAISLTFFSGAKKLVSGHYDQTVSIWDLGENQSQLSIRGHESYVFATALSPDGETLVTGSADGDVKLWKAADAQQCQLLRGHEANRTEDGFSVAFSPDGKILASSGVGVATLWDVETGNDLVSLQGYADSPGGITVAFAPIGDILATGDANGTLKLWNTKLRRLLASWKGHGGQVRDLAFSPNGRTLATASRGDQLVKIWDTSTQSLQASLPHAGGVRSLAYKSDGRLLATCHKRRSSDFWVVDIWEVATSKILKTLPTESDGISWVAWAPDGKTFAMGDGDRAVKLWDSSTWSVLNRFIAHTNVVIRGTFSPDGKTLATASWDGTVKLWHVATGQELLKLPETGACWAVAFSPDGKTLATGSDEVALWCAAAATKVTQEDKLGENDKARESSR